MTNYEKIKRAVIKAVPEVMELKFGCKVQTHIYPSYPIELTVFRKEYKTGVVSCLDKENELCYLSENDIEILGRPITLADVLIVVRKVGYDSTEEWQWTLSNILDSWNLTKTLEDQSEKTLEFLAGII